MNTSSGHEFGALLHGLRERERVTQIELARRLGLHRNTIGAWERGDYLPDLTRVYEIIAQLCLDEDAANLLFRAHSTRTAPVAPWNLPSQRNRFFTGRDTVLQELHQGLHGDRESSTRLTRAYALSGLAGVGKTQTALEYAYRFHHEYRAVFWLQADSPETIVSSYLAIAQALDLPEKREHDQQRIVKAVQLWLAMHHHWLLICDNVEDLALLSQYLPTTRYGSLLLTTRAQAIGNLAQSLELSVLSPQEAMLLLLRRATILREQQSVEQAERGDRNMAALIADLLGGLPLALDQAGAYIEEHACSLSDYLALYQSHRPTLLRERGGSSIDHPASVATTFALAFEQLQQQQPAAADLLRLCAFLAPDGIPLELITGGAAHLGPQLQGATTNPLTLNVLIKAALHTSLMHKHARTRTLSMHRLVQNVLKDGMDRQTQQVWSERVMRAINQIFPHEEMNVEQWPLCERLLPHVYVCMALSEQCSGALPEMQALLLKTANYLIERAQYRQAEFLCLRARGICEQHFGPSHPATIACLITQTRLAYQQGSYEEAEASGLQALALCEQVPELSHSTTAARCLITLGRLAVEQGRYEYAETLCQRALVLYEQTMGSDDPMAARCRIHLGLLHWYQGRYQESVRLYHQALATCEQVLGPAHPDTVTCLAFLGQVYGSLDRDEEAESFCQRALALSEQAVGTFHPSTIQCLIIRATLLNQQRKYQESEQVCQRALGIVEQVLGPVHYFRTVVLYILASLYRDTGRYTEAEALLLQALAFYEQLFGNSHFLTATALMSLALLYQDQGQYEVAEQYCRRGLVIQKQVLGLSHPHTIRSLCILAELEQAPHTPSQ